MERSLILFSMQPVTWLIMKPHPSGTGMAYVYRGRKGKQLAKIQAYQEYWHSWMHFHPGTLWWEK